MLEVSLKEAKRTVSLIVRLLIFESNIDQVRATRLEITHLVYKMVDTCAAEFKSSTPYLPTYEREMDNQI